MRLAGFGPPFFWLLPAVKVNEAVMAGENSA